MTTHTPPPDNSEDLDSLLSIIYDDDEYTAYPTQAEIADALTLFADDTQPIDDTELPFASFDEGGD